LLKRDLTHQRYIYCAYVCGSLRCIFIILRLELVCSDADAFNFNVGEESVSDDFGNIDGSADGSSAGFDADFLGAAVEEGDACEDIVHYGFFADQDSVGVFAHGSASLLVYFLSSLSYAFYDNKYVVVYAWGSR
jgi:hypothetical protein